MVRLFRIFIPVSVVVLLISEIVLISGAFLAAVWLHYESEAMLYLVDSSGFISTAVVLLTILLGLYLHDLYTEIYVTSYLGLLQQLCFILGGAFLVEGMVSYLYKPLRMPLHVMIPGAGFTLVGIYAWRVFFSSYVSKKMGGERLLLVGSSPVLIEVAEHVHAHPEKGVSIIGVITEQSSWVASRRCARW
jgi:FlaA1/EpsC-like NDP-sugar epimerase